MIINRLGARPMILSLPIGSEDNFRGLIDLVTMKALVWFSDEKDAQWEEWEITDDLAAKLKIEVKEDFDILRDIPTYRQELIDTALEQDDAAMEAIWKPVRTPTSRRSAKCIRKGTVTGAFTPVIAGSSFKNKGAADAGRRRVVPALPTDVEAIKVVDENGEVVGERNCSDEEPFSALAFSHQQPVRRADLRPRLFRRGAEGHDPAELHPRQARAHRPHGRGYAKDTNAIEECRAGDIIAFVSLAETETGDTPCDPASPVILERMKFPDPVISVSVEPKAKGDQEKLGGTGQDGPRRPVAPPGAGQGNRADHSARHGRAAPGDHHRPYPHRVRRGSSRGRPQVAYRETITSKIEHIYTHKKQTGGWASSPK